jgi:hypothetical protein
MSSKPEAGDDGAERIRKMVREYLDTMEEARDRASLARDYYDGKQWTREEIATLKQRGQPPIVFNRIKRKVDSILGVERNRRTDPKAYPRTPRDEQSADIVTQALRFVSDQTRLNNIFSGAFENGMIEGAGAAEVIMDGPEDIKVNLIPWDEFIFDPRSSRHDFSDARYLGVLKWMDADDAIALYQDKAKEIEAGITGSEKAFVADVSVDDKPSSGTWIDRKRRRVQVCQLYYKQGSEHNYAVVVGSVLIMDGPSYYRDEKGRTVCPIEAFSAYVDRENNRYGVVADMRGPQDEINHRRSKAVHFLHSRRVMAQQGAVADVSQAKREIARPDGWVEVVDPQSVQVLDTQAETTGNLNMLQEAKSEIDLLGPNNALQGKNTEGQSGRAIIAQQQAGLAELAPLYDRFNDFKLRVYRATWARIKQFWTSPKWIRVTDDEQSVQFIGLNQVQGIDPMTMQPQVSNPVAQMDVDVILETGPDTVTLQSEEFEQLAQIMPQLAALPPPYALALIEASSLPAQRKKKMTELLSGQGQQQDPEAMAMQKRAAEAEIAGKEAEVEYKRSQAAATMSKAQLDSQLAPLQLEMERQKLGSEAETRALERERMMLERESSDQERAFKSYEMQTRSRESEQRLMYDRERAISEDNFRSQEAMARAKPEPDPALAEMDEMNRQAIEQLSALDERIGQLTEGIVAVVQGQARLEQALSAEKELVRDPKTGKALGVRIKKGNI